MIARAEVLQIDNFASFGRLIRSPVTVKKPAKATHRNPAGSLKDSIISGRVHIDISEVIFRLKRSCGLEKCSLKYACEFFLKETKNDDVPYEMIPELWTNNKFTR